MMIAERLRISTGFFTSKKRKANAWSEFTYIETSRLALFRFSSIFFILKKIFEAVCAYLD